MRLSTTGTTSTVDTHERGEPTAGPSDTVAA
jgi:hypothetical protein